MLILFAVIIGALISFMVTLNGGLQAHLGPIPALTVIHIVGLGASILFSPLLGGIPKEKRRRPLPLLYLAGTLGLPIVYLNNRVFLEGGVLLTLSGMLAGQSLTAALLESSPWRSLLPGHPLQRIVPLLLILPGTLAIASSAGVGPLWLLLSWLPGGLLMLQLIMNSRLAGAIGQGRMLGWNYLSGLTPLLLLLTFGWDRYAPDPTLLFSTPLLLLSGGGLIGVAVVGAQSRLLGRMQPLTMVLGTYLGQFAAGILLDLLALRTLDGFYLVGVGLVALGLFAGEALRRR